MLVYSSLLISLIVTQTNAQNLTDAQLAVLSQRLADGAQRSWELGTRSQTILELNATLYSVFSNNLLPPPSSIPSSALSNFTSSPFFPSNNRNDNTIPLQTVLGPFFSIPQRIVSNRGNANNGAVGPQPFLPDGSAADPASVGVSALVANWTGRGASDRLDYTGAAKDQLDFLLMNVPRTNDGAISHRMGEVQLWSDFVYMVPPFLAYYGVMTQNRTLLLEAYNQIKLYRNYLRDSHAKNKWRHVLLGTSNNDPGYWTTGNGWAAAGMLRVLATIRNSQFSGNLKGQQKDLAKWVKEIHDGMYTHLDPNINLWANYPDRPATDPGNFYDTSGSALLASTVFRGAVMLDQFTYVPAAERVRQTLFSPASPNTQFNGMFVNYPHLTPDGWPTPVVNPYSYGNQGSRSPESVAFALQLHAAWRDWVADGARGANTASKLNLQPWLSWMLSLVLGIVMI